MRNFVASSSAALLLGACTSVPSTPTGAPTEADLATFAAFDAARFPGAPQVLAGFAEPDAEREFRVGDAVLFGLEVDDGTTRVRRLLKLEVRSLMPASADLDVETRTIQWKRGKHQVHWRSTRTKVDAAANGGEPETVVDERTLELTPIQLGLRLYDEQGTQLSESTAVLYDEPLEQGFWPISGAKYEAEAGLLPMTLLLTLQRLGADDTVLHELLFTVVQKPSLFSVIGHFGIDVVISARQGGAGPTVRLGARDVACNVLPIDLDVNGTRAMNVHLVCCEPAPPSAVGAGIVGAIAKHPTDARSAVFRLLATHRGKKEERSVYRR